MHVMAVTADHLLVLGRGRVLADCPTGEFVERHPTLEDAFLAVTSGTTDHQGRVR